MKWQNRFLAGLCKLCQQHKRRCKHQSTLTINSALIEASIIGDLSLVRVFIQYADNKRWAIYKASRHDREDVLEYLQTHYLSLPPSNLVEKKTGISDMQDYVVYGIAIKHNVPTTLLKSREVLFEAMLNGDLEAVSAGNWIDGFEYHYREKAFCIAAEYGHLHILEWALNKGVHRGNEHPAKGVNDWFNILARTIHHAAKGNHVNILRGWVSNIMKGGLNWHVINIYGIVYHAIRCGHKEILHFMVEMIQRHGDGRTCVGQFLSYERKLNLCVCAIMDCRRDSIGMLLWLNDQRCVVGKSRLKRIIKRHYGSAAGEILEELSWV